MQVITEHEKFLAGDPTKVKTPHLNLIKFKSTHGGVYTLNNM